MLNLYVSYLGNDCDKKTLPTLVTCSLTPSFQSCGPINFSCLRLPVSLEYSVIIIWADYNTWGELESCCVVFQGNTGRKILEK